MSRANVEVVQAVFDAWNAGNTDGFGALHDPDVIWAAFEGWPEAETLIGREACMSQYERMRAAFDVDTVEPITDFITAGDRVVVRLIWRGTGKGPDVNMERFCSLIWLISATIGLGAAEPSAGRKDR
jgi:ketosteroid isomerase-like protein